VNGGVALYLLRCHDTNCRSPDRKYTPRFFDDSGSTRSAADEPRWLRARNERALREGEHHSVRRGAFSAQALVALFVITKMRQEVSRKNSEQMKLSDDGGQRLGLSQ